VEQESKFYASKFINLNAFSRAANFRRALLQSINRMKTAENG
jgi:hypothetical protein